MRCSLRGALASLSLLALLVSEVSGGTLQSYQATGTLGLEVAGYSNPAGALPFFGGTLSLSQIPAGAIVQKAFVYAGDWNNAGAALDLSFNFSAPITSGPMNTDGGLSTLYGYRWDVTPLVLGAPAAYTFSIGNTGTMGNQMPGAALVVVWSDPTAPTSTVTIVDGALQVGENTPAVPDTETMTFSGMPAGTTDLHLFTISDDAAGSNEVIDYNGNTVGGPIDENLGLGASVISLSNLTSISPANNVVSVTSPADHFGWIVSATLVPEPSSATLLFLAIPILAATAWRRAGQRRGSPS
jgi:Protein of unknown function (DUF3344)